MSRTTKDERQGDIFALLDAPAPPPPRPLPTTGAELLAQAIACCGTCAKTSPAAGPECRTIWTDEHGLECFDCIGERCTNCQDCGKRFHKDLKAHWRGDRQWITPEAGAICYRCKEWRDLNKPAKELAKDEATPEAMIAFGKLAWIDDRHRYRALNRLRNGLKDRGSTCGIESVDRKAKKSLIEVEHVERLYRITRHRPLEQIAAELWTVLDAYDRAIRAGEPVEKHGRQLVDDYIAEANDGTMFGCKAGRHDNPGPLRLWALVRWRARREGRLPMWGLPGVFRIECRGMHIVVTTHYAYRRGSTYASEGFHLDVDRHRPGDPSFSSTGYRSLGYGPADGGDTPQAAAQRALEEFIDGPTKHGSGLNGKLERWSPFVIEYALKRRMGDRMFQPHSDDPEDDRHEHWNKLADEGEAWIARAGISDPFELFPRMKRQEGLAFDEPAEEPEEEDFEDEDFEEEEPEE